MGVLNSQGQGKDTLIGGAGADRFVFNAALGIANVDTLLDFRALDGDTIALDGAVFNRLIGRTTLADHVRSSAQAPSDDDDYIVYDTSTGELAYDASGNGTLSPIVFAILANRPQDLTATQFTVI